MSNKTRNKSIQELDWKGFFNYIDRLELSKVPIDLPKSKTVTQRTLLKNLSTAYKEDKLVLVLGAGVSIEFGIPSWNELLQNLMVHTIEKDQDISNTLSKLFNSIFTPNPLIAGRYLQNYIENNNKSFETTVRDVLYNNAEKNKKSELLAEIVKLCVAPGKSPNLDSIITYNFDDILEYKLQSADMDIPFRSVYGIGIQVKSDELPIYHVHGYLPEEQDLTKNNEITFGENNYHQQYSDVYSWNNIVQINKFRDNTCLFIGSSLTDPNIRRLLDIALKQKGNSRKQHYVFKRRLSIRELKMKLQEANADNNINIESLNINEKLRLLVSIYERFEENDSASFGVQTVWIDSFIEIPNLLKRIRKMLPNN